MSYYNDRELKKKKRIGNVAASPIAGDDRYAYEILFYYPNPYYGRENEYVKNEEMGWYESPEHRNVKIHSGSFKSPENCYVLAFVTNGEEPDVISVGLRPWELSGSDDIAFREILKYVFSEDENERNYDE